MTRLLFCGPMASSSGAVGNQTASLSRTLGRRPLHAMSETTCATCGGRGNIVVPDPLNPGHTEIDPCPDCGPLKSRSEASNETTRPPTAINGAIRCTILATASFMLVPISILGHMWYLAPVQLVGGALFTGLALKW